MKLTRPSSSITLLTAWLCWCSGCSQSTLALAVAPIESDAKIRIQTGQQNLAVKVPHADGDSNQLDVRVVEIRFYVQKIHSMNGNSQTFYSSGVLALRWNLSADSSAQWQPRLALWNAELADPDSQALQPQSRLRLERHPSTGQPMAASTELILQPIGHCDHVNFVHFPKDRHNCSFQVLFADSLSELEARFQLRTAGDGPADFLAGCHGGWQVLSVVDGVAGVAWPGGYRRSVYTFSVSVRRDHRYYLVSMLLPVLYLVLLLFVVFSLPVSIGPEKIQLSLTVLLAFSVYLMLTDQMMPKIKQVPALSHFLNSLMLIASIYVCATAATCRLVQPGDSTSMLLWKPLRAALLAVGTDADCPHAMKRLATQIDRGLMTIGVLSITLLFVVLVLPLL